MSSNRQVLCLVNSTASETYEANYEVVYSALDFYKAPYTILDIATEDLEGVGENAVILVAQQGVLGALSESAAHALADAVFRGAGLVSFDGDIHAYPDAIKALGGVRTREGFSRMPHTTAAQIRVWDVNHFITKLREPEFISLNKPIECGDVVNVSAACTVLVRIADSGGQVGIFSGTYGSGKFVLSSLSSRLWQREYLGHGGGLDDLFWRSIVWSARKPFAMLAMPPFATARIDDCSGEDHFGWVDTFHKHGWIPHVSLFLDNIDQDLGGKIKRLYDDGVAEFSPHAFDWARQIFWKPAAPLEHRSGRCYTHVELEEVFGRVDAFAAGIGITWSHVSCPHFGDIGHTALQFLREREMTLLNRPLAAETRLKFTERGLLPYGGQGGVIDTEKMADGFFVISPGYDIVPKALTESLVARDLIKPVGESYDFLWANGRRVADIEKCAEYGSFGILHQLRSLMPVVLTTHEQNITILTPQEWDRLLSGIGRKIAQYELIHTSWTHMGEYARCRHGVGSASVRYDKSAGAIEVDLTGRSEMQLLLHVYRDENGTITRDLRPLAPVEGPETQLVHATLKDSCTEPGETIRAKRKGEL